MARRFLTGILMLTTLVLFLAPLVVLAGDEPAAAAGRPQPPTLAGFLTSAKYLTMLGIMIGAVVLLLTRRINIWIRTGIMAASFILFGAGVVFSLHPSPMCATTKLYMFKFTMGRFFPAFIAFALVIFVPSLLGRKLFCGWICPLGAFQELLNKIPHRFKIKQPGFNAMNTLRLALIALFVLNFHAGVRHIQALGQALEADTGNRIWRAFSSINIYEPVNMFELLHWQVDTTFIVMIVILVIASLVLYRPFCYAICPIGGLTWLLERIAPGRIRIDMDACNSCGLCVKATPCPTMEPLLAGKTGSLPDCTSCGECLNTCPTDAIYFGLAERGKKTET